MNHIEVVCTDLVKLYNIENLFFLNSRFFVRGKSLTSHNIFEICKFNQSEDNIGF